MMPYRNELQSAHARVNDLERLYRNEIRRGDRLAALLTQMQRKLWGQFAKSWLLWFLLIWCAVFGVLGTLNHVEAVQLEARAAAHERAAVRACIYTPSLRVDKGASSHSLNP